MATRTGFEPVSSAVTGRRNRPDYANEPLFGGATWSWTKNVYHEGPDLQSGDAHAIASIAPKYLVGAQRIEL